MLRCVKHTVESLLVHYGAASQGFIVLLVTHQCVHTQDGWKKPTKQIEYVVNKLRLYKGISLLKSGPLKIISVIA